MPEAVHDVAAAVTERTADNSELESPSWAVLSFDKAEGGNLIYADAVRLLSELDAKGIAGLCIVTDQTAARLAR